MRFIQALALVCLGSSLLLLGETSFATRVEVRDDSVKELSTTPSEVPTGRSEVTKYFKKRTPAAAQASSASSREHYLGLHLGGFMSSDAYVWGRDDHTQDVGKMTIGVTYRMGEWINAADFLMRADFISYEVDESKPLKMTILFAAAFPDANSRFPLYFGGGMGPGIFFKQAKNESPISLDYQLFGGLRFFDVFDGIGFFGEAGLKNHFHLLSDGQFNSVFYAVGALFTF